MGKAFTQKKTRDRLTTTKPEKVENKTRNEKTINNFIQNKSWKTKGFQKRRSKVKKKQMKRNVIMSETN